MKKDIFKTLNDYSSGFHRTATQEDCAIYDAEIERIKARILADVDHSPEIIAEEFAKFCVIEYRKMFSGEFFIFNTTPEYKAVDNIYMALLDSKPLKSLPLRCNAEQNASKIDQDDLKPCKQKAVKEFAETLKSEMSEHYDTDNTRIYEIIDDLLAVGVGIN